MATVYCPTAQGTRVNVSATPVQYYHIDKVSLTHCAIRAQVQLLRLENWFIVWHQKTRWRHAEEAASNFHSFHFKRRVFNLWRTKTRESESHHRAIEFYRFNLAHQILRNLNQYVHLNRIEKRSNLKVLASCLKRWYALYNKKQHYKKLYSFADQFSNFRIMNHCFSCL